MRNRLFGGVLLAALVAFVAASVIVQAPYKYCDPLWRLFGWC